MNKLFNIFLLVALCLCTVPLFAQTPDTVTVTNDYTMGTINTTIQGDTTLSGDRVNPLRVYKLVRGGWYILNGALITKEGTHIRIYGEPAPTDGSADPGMAVLIEGTSTSLYYSYNIHSYGDLTIENVWLYYVTDGGTQNWTAMQFETENSTGTFTNCIFDYCTAICVTTSADHFKCYFKNCIFRNCIDPSQWWAGRQVCTVATTAGIDTCISTNCSFENMGFVFQTDYVPPLYCYYDHNTFINIAKFSFKFYYFTHLIATNNIFFNNHFTGERYFDRVGQDPDKLLWGQALDCDTIPEGTVYHDVAETERVCVWKNNATYTQSDFQTFYDDYNAIDSVANSGNGTRALIYPEPIMNDRTIDMFTWHPNFVLSGNIDHTEDNGEAANPGFTVPATQMDSILGFMSCRYVKGGNNFWGFDVKYDGSALKEDLSYSNTTLQTAGTDGLPLGDLYHWFPAQYATWLQNQTAVEKTSSTVPSAFSLNQNYPNPFNPTTQIEYNVPKNAFVSLKVYNVLGQEVATLQNGLQAPGSYKATFNAKNLATGMYIYTLKAGEQSFSKKMMLIK